MLVESKQICGVMADPLDWIILRSVWASWKWPRAAHWSWGNQRRGSSCQFLEGISAALSHLLRVNASQKPGGLSQLRLALHGGTLLCLEVQLPHTAEKITALEAASFPAQRVLLKAFLGWQKATLVLISSVATGKSGLARRLQASLLTPPILLPPVDWSSISGAECRGGARRTPEEREE